MRRRFRVAPGSIWHRLDLEEFCEHCELSERTGRYALQRIREEAEEHGIRFRTVFKHDNGSKGSWVVLFANEAELLFDQEPLFRTEDGRHRHIRPKLTDEEVIPGKQGHRIDGERRSAPRQGGDKGEDCERSQGDTGQSPAGGGSPCKPYIGRVFYEHSADKNKHAGSGDSNASGNRFRHRWRTKPITKQGEHRLRRKAGAITRRIAAIWWDNCKVANPDDSPEARAGILGYVLGAMREGFTEAEITGAADLALHRLHMTATDRGEWFTVASTITRAREILAKDTRTRAERVTAFYEQRKRDLEAVREAMAETRGGGKPCKPL